MRIFSYKMDRCDILSKHSSKIYIKNEVIAMLLIVFSNVKQLRQTFVFLNARKYHSSHFDRCWILAPKSSTFKRYIRVKKGLLKVCSV